MLRREDFYQINDRTLKAFYAGMQGKTRLYVYPELNAIVTFHPSKAVREYLYTEFRVNASFVKRAAVHLYTRFCLYSGGLLAARSFDLPALISADTLIYPCNKKYRIFDFAHNEVSVIPKDGFSIEGLKNEISFRLSHSANFILPLISAGECGYTERIIDGYPLARAGTRIPELKQKSFDLWQAYVASSVREVPAKKYVNILLRSVTALCDRAKKSKVDFNAENAYRLGLRYASIVSDSSGTVPVSLSHGDLQPGNIWIENGTGKIYIIDWESYSERSLWYDYATLFGNIRMPCGMNSFFNDGNTHSAIVALEDLIFRLEELISLPMSYGIPELNDTFSSLLKR